MQSTITTMTDNSQDNKIEIIKYDSSVYTQLHRYPTISKFLTKFQSTPLISKASSVLGSMESKMDASAPPVIKKGINKVLMFLMSIDQLINLLVFREGIDSFLKTYKNHSNHVGVWILWFIVDYFANISNIILHEFVIKPLHLNISKKNNETPEESIKNITGKSDGKKTIASLPHLAELSNTTRSLREDLQSRVTNSNYITQTKDKAYEKLDSIMKPTYDSAKETYKTVSDSYESNLHKSDSVPRAIVSTGVEIGSLTLDKLKSVSTTKTIPTTASSTESTATDDANTTFTESTPIAASD
ncbi:Pln1p NDAI_0B05280 [Naumovozyma dairenensis CBS 421]|uniref:Uncharacterized protein n=1 Tax=Naumovozyma dairenensis (strain ATCC 10597 / BCRC 20456 / CBS 421 / NBRC 0211 / NRRL Y-12639) TaxID=1071378 RepID=G0W700_NAUDC|nr:hypothetical protein NDAI_0B05280 [Naumovozyma dairenensis CBS 421]CCD23561.1 hypothetical protein NDAI_0B05280 [Naumovozyma dairenensis CBS 421]